MADERTGRVEPGVSDGLNEGHGLAAQSEEWMRTASDPSLVEDGALGLLKEAGLSGAILETLSKNKKLMMSRKVRVAVVGHPKTPRHVSVPAIRQLYTFDLMNVALSPVVPADVKMAAEEALIVKVDSISQGERLTLARRASGRVAAALLADLEERIVRAALENGRLTEALVAAAVACADVPAHTVMAVCEHPKWSLRQEVRLALLRSEKTPVSKAVEFARGLPGGLLRELLLESRLPVDVKERLMAGVDGD